MDKTLYIIDSYGLIYRSYYAFISRPLVNEKNENVSALYGFFNNLLSLIQKNDVKYLAAAFDSKGKTFRHEMFSEYKATRQKTPEDLHAQIPFIQEALEKAGLKVLQNEGFEADDIIASLCKKANENGWECKILSSDKDLMQLINEKTQMVKSDKTGGWIFSGIEEVQKEWGVLPEQMLDILSLIGDTADNVPGIKGIGEKTAIKLLSEYKNLDSILEHASEISGSTGKKIQEGRESAKFSRELIKLRYDVPLDCCMDDFSIENADFAETAKVLYKYGIPSVAKRYEGLAKKTGKTGQSTFEKNGEPKTEPKKAQVTSDLSDEENLGTETFELTENTGDYQSILNKEKLHQIIDGFLANKADDGRIYVAFDTETNGLDIMTSKLAGFSICAQERKSYYVPFVTKENLNPTDLFSDAPEYVSQNQAFEELSRLFFNPDVTMLMHNAKFDIEILISNGFFTKFGGEPSGERANFKCKVYDTMIAAWLLQSEKQSISLEKLAETKLHLKTIPFESLVKKGETFFDVPLETAVKYGAEDSDLTLMLWHHFEPILKEQNLFDLFENLEMPLIPILAQMEISGIHIEKDELALYGQELSSNIENLEHEIFEITGHEFNIASPKQLADVLFNERGLSPTKGKKGSTDSEVLEELKDQDELPGKILEYRKNTKLKSTYVDSLGALADKNDKLHTNFFQTGTATGRLSSRDPNLQNIPVRDESGRRIRQSFSASKGNSLISADYAQIELVILAHLSKDKNMCDAFNKGVDVHKSTAALIFGVDAENVTPEMRRSAKVINFGVIYGMSAFKLANDLGITRTQASEFIKQYFSKYSGVHKLITDIITNCGETGYVETLFGRKRYIRAINSANKIEKAGAERIAVNTPIQGTAADVVKKAMISVYNALQEKFPQAKMLLQVHDELIVECPEEQAQNVAALIKDCMENVVKLNVPLRVSVEIGKRWGEFH
ncbi:MAG: DNA polymerase I [Treponemataceae bacterium]|nr:DNA polymerase I [Spirochaetales bacterium]MDY6031778.1 DNA polymerase I [Treponemataceae bacterium]